MRDRIAELAEIEGFIEQHGPTVCPARYATAVRAALSREEKRRAWAAKRRRRTPTPGWFTRKLRKLAAGIRPAGHDSSR